MFSRPQVQAHACSFATWIPRDACLLVVCLQPLVSPRPWERFNHFLMKATLPRMQGQQERRLRSNSAQHQLASRLSYKTQIDFHASSYPKTRARALRSSNDGGLCSGQDYAGRNPPHAQTRHTHTHTSNPSPNTAARHLSVEYHFDCGQYQVQLYSQCIHSTEIMVALFQALSDNPVDRGKMLTWP